MSRNADFQSKIKKRIRILFSRKKCRSCLTSFDQQFALSDVFNSVSFIDEENVTIFLYGKGLPVIKKYKIIKNIPIKLTTINQNKFRKRPSTKLMTMCGCGEVTELNVALNYFG